MNINEAQPWWNFIIRNLSHSLRLLFHVARLFDFCLSLTWFLSAYNSGFLPFSCRFSHSLPLTPAPICAHSAPICACLHSLLLTPTHSHSLPHALMHGYLWENDKSPFIQRGTQWGIHNQESNPSVSIKFLMMVIENRAEVVIPEGFPCTDWYFLKKQHCVSSNLLF